MTYLMWLKALMWITLDLDSDLNKLNTETGQLYYAVACQARLNLSWETLK